MTDTERTDLNIKLALILGAKWSESRGWRQDLEYPNPTAEDCVSWASKWSYQTHWSGPDFTSSIDAQAPLVKLVEDRGLQAKYMVKLRKLLDDEKYQDWSCAHAPALIRAQAFLEVLS